MALTDYILAPIYIPQALWIAARATRLPEAAGPRSGEIGQGPSMRVLVLGDSSAAGVGVTHQSDALGGRLSSELAHRFTVTWRVMAASGATVKSTLSDLRALPPEAFDVVLIALGVNDAKNCVPLKAWSDRYATLLDVLRDKAHDPLICISGLPPVRHFPILPWPLNRVLGHRAEMFDAQLRQIALSRSRVTHLPLDFTRDTSQMAEDGFHPGAPVYAEWARRAAALF